jgi:endonuclease/exonuclease/phosphatase (EEP) superfamily protein YafD
VKKLLLIGLPIVAVIIGLPILALAVITTSTTAAADCRRAQQEGTGNVAVAPPAGSGTVRVAQANIKVSLPLPSFRADLAQVAADSPDLVSLNEVSRRSNEEITPPDYQAWRVPAPDRGDDGTAVLWRTDRWSRVDQGRVVLVDHGPQKWDYDRGATWVTLQSEDLGRVSMVSVHHMINPAKYGPNKPLRQQLYRQGMERLQQLVEVLSSSGPVFVAGDFNSQWTANDPWGPRTMLGAVGMKTTMDELGREATHGGGGIIDYVLYQPSVATPTRQWIRNLNSDHHLLAANFSVGSEVTDDIEVGETSAAVPAVATTDVQAGLMQLRISDSYPTITAEQANNAIAIAEVARDLEIPRYGLQIAIATAIQESKLVNLAGGDRDSGGLFQQRPSAGWGTREQITNPRLAAEAFFGEAKHTNNPGLLDIPNWEQLPLTQAAQAVQRSGFPDAYAQWESVAKEIAALLGGDLSDVEGNVEPASDECAPEGDTIAPVTLGSFNILGAGHTDGRGGHEKHGFAGWQSRLPKAIDALETKGVTIAGLQEVHGAQENALASRYGQKWGMYPENVQQNKVIWDRNSWQMTDARLIDIPYFNGHDVGMPLVQLTSTSTGQSIWVWSIHNPASTRGDARRHRIEALRRQLDTMTDLKATGEPVVILGDFNDGKDGKNSSHCALTPELSNAFGGSADPCKKPGKDAPIDHVYGANLTWDSARVDNSPQAKKISDHPLVIATTAGSNLGCAVGESMYNLGPVKPQLTRLVNILGPMFDIKTVGGYRESATDPNGHPAGLAADFMVPLTPAGKAQGDALVAYAQQHAKELGIDYIIWYQRIWSVGRSDEGWRPMEDRGSDTQNHKDHPHINVLPDAPAGPVGDAAGSSCGEVVYPVPAQYIANDAHNWHNSGSHWDSWHTGTDFGAPCGTPVYAAHAGTIEIDTTQGWAGPWLVKVTTGPESLTTWYAHMEKITVSRGETVAPGQQIGEVGNEGNSEGCHLHFEVHLENGSIYGLDNVDPSEWLANNASRPDVPA